MKANRVEAFTDGVIAIIITIMVLELSPPEAMTSEAILGFLGSVGIYAISFIYVGIFWMNHHHLFQTVKRVNGKILIANLAILFFISLVPLGTAWISEELVTDALLFYGFALAGSAVMYSRLVNVIMENDNEATKSIYLKHGKKKEYVSIILYCTGLLFAFISPILSLLLYFGVSLIWIVPDTRIESNIEEVCN